MGRRPPQRTALVAVLVGQLLLGGCSAEDGRRTGQAPTSAAPTSAGTSAPASAAPTTAAPTTAASTTAASTAAPPARPPTTRPPAAPPTTRPPTPAAPLACAGTDREVLPVSARVVALTVDLGGDAAGVPAILRALSAERVQATFFTTGAWARRYPRELADIVAAGHVVGNHTETHPHLPALTDAQVRAQLQSTEDVVRAQTGRSSKPLFRFPFGERDARTLRVVNDAGYCAYRWTVDTLGWKGTGAGLTAQTVVDRVLAALRPGEIVLMHGGANPDDGSTLDADALPDVLRELRARGYGFSTLG